MPGVPLEHWHRGLAPTDRSTIMGHFSSSIARPPTVLTVPGLGNSGPAHWQTLWEQGRLDTHRVDLGMWDTPHRNAWVTKLDQAISSAQAPVILVGHSLGCQAIAWHPRLCPTRMTGACALEIAWSSFVTQALRCGVSHMPRSTRCVSRRPCSQRVCQCAGPELPRPGTVRTVGGRAMLDEKWPMMVLLSVGARPRCQCSRGTPGIATSTSFYILSNSWAITQFRHKVGSSSACDEAIGGR